MPEWAADYPLPGEDDLIAQLRVTDDEIAGLRDRLEALSGRLDDRRRNKRLFTAMGNDLEEAVDTALTSLGFREEKLEKPNRIARIAWDGERGQGTGEERSWQTSWPSDDLEGRVPPAEREGGGQRNAHRKRMEKDVAG